MLLAERQGWRCVTNDKRLRTECETRGVTLMWGLEMLIKLVQEGALPVDVAIEAGHAVHSINKRLPKKVIDEFVKQVKKFK